MSDPLLEAALALLTEIAKSPASVDPERLRWKATEFLHRNGHGAFPSGYRLIHPSSGTVEDWSLDQILEEINRDHSDDFSPYTATDDVREGLREWTEWRVIDDNTP
jgi:hypothetical protein